MRLEVILSHLIILDNIFSKIFLFLSELFLSLDFFGTILFVPE